MDTLSGQTDLAIRTLRDLASSAAGTSLERLATALETTSDRLLLILAPLTHAGWVERGLAGPDTFRYTRPDPAPTLHEVVEAIEGSTPIDDCVLRPGVPCGAFQSASVCVAHHEWLGELNASVLPAVPLAVLLHPVEPRAANVASIDPGLRLSPLPGPTRDPSSDGEPDPPTRAEAALESAPAGPVGARLPATPMPPC